MTRTNEMGLFERAEKREAGPASTVDGRWVLKTDANALSPFPNAGGSAFPVFAKRPRSYDEMFRDAVRRAGASEAIVCGDRRLTYDDLNRLVDQFAHALAARNIAKGDRVCLLLGNSLEYVVSFLGILRAGGVVVPLGTRLGREDIAYIVGDSAPALCVTDAELAHKFADAAVTLVDDVMDEGARGTSTPLPHLVEEDLMLLVYTSGTTGRPKGACISHRNMIHTSLHYIYVLSPEAPIRTLFVVPCAHIAGIGPVMSTTFAAAGTLVMMKEFKAVQVARVIERERINFTVLVPAMYQLMMIDPAVDQYDMSNWIYGVYGGAIMPSAVIAKVAAKLPGLRLINAYGATETTAVCTMMDADDTKDAPDSVGYALHCCELNVVDGSGRTVQPGETGELWIRGPNVVSGYWRNDRANEVNFQDGFWKSGDVCSVDEKGRVFVHDRIKDMINRGGYKIFSAEIEGRIIEYEGVKDCAVVGVPDDILGERSFAFVHVGGPDVSEERIRRHLLDSIADYKIPDYWFITEDTVPRNQNGKVQKVQVRELALSLILARAR